MRGGKREGAGRPKGTFKAEPNQRKSRSVAAFDDEWELINRFAKVVKYGDKDLAIKLLDRLENEDAGRTFKPCAEGLNAVEKNVGK